MELNITMELNQTTLCDSMLLTVAGQSFRDDQCTMVHNLEYFCLENDNYTALQNSEKNCKQIVIPLLIRYLGQLVA